MRKDENRARGAPADDRWPRSRSSWRPQARRSTSRVQGGLDLRRPAQRRRLVAGARRGQARRAEGAGSRRFRRRTRRTSLPARSSSRRSRASFTGLQDDLRDVVRLLRQEARGQVSGRPSSSRRPEPRPPRTSRSTSARRGHDLPLGHGGRRCQQNRQARPRRRIPDSGSDPAFELATSALCARLPAP